jgi:hypothetical protein
MSRDAYTSGIQEGSEAADSSKRSSANFAQAEGFEWQEIGLRKFVVSGPFQDPALLREKLAGYVRSVARFKDSVASRNGL